MITCNRCGNAAPTGAAICPGCGMPLSSKAENEFSPKAGTQGQTLTELPAWLEALRAGERPAVPTKSPSSFTAADPVEEGALPEWMRSEQTRGSNKGHSGSQQTMQPSSFSAPTTDEGALSKGLTARSLIDEQSLPSWMQNTSGNTGPGALPPSPGSISTESLVQQDAMPEWIKNIQKQPSPAVEPAQSRPQAAQPFQQVPSTPFTRPVPPEQQWEKPAEPLAQGFSPQDLIDQQSLPPWMMQQSGQNAPTASNSGQTEQIGISTASLLDMGAMPQWMREAQKSSSFQQAAALQAQPAQSRQVEPSLTQSPLMQQSMLQQEVPQVMQAPPMNTSVGSDSVSAASFIDVNALPEWLRSAATPQQATEVPQRPDTGNNPRSGSYGIPPRVENVRVPSRPRGEMQASEGSEVAANVFASMLGVTSAPNYSSPPTSSPHLAAPPGPNTPSGMNAAPAWQMQPGMPQGMAGPPQPGMPQGMAGPSQPSMPQGMAGPSQPGMPQGMAGPPQPSMPQGMAGPQSQQGYRSGVSYPGTSQSNAGYPNGYAMGIPPMGLPPNPANMPGIPPVPGKAGVTGEGHTGAKPAKRGLFNAIREWFFH